MTLAVPHIIKPAAHCEPFEHYNLVHICEPFEHYNLVHICEPSGYSNPSTMRAERQIEPK